MDPDELAFRMARAAALRLALSGSTEKTRADGRRYVAACMHALEDRLRPFNPHLIELIELNIAAGTLAPPWELRLGREWGLLPMPANPLSLH